MYEKLLNRRSERNYTGEAIDETTINEIKNVINSSPTSINAHGFSAIVITDQKVKDEMSKLNWGQPHLSSAGAIILFLGDMNRLKLSLGSDFETISPEMKEEFIMVSAVDATIASGLVTAYAVDKGLGTCYLGGPRTYPEQLKTLLNLNDDVFPVVGLTIGKIAGQNDIRPKLNKVYEEKYDVNQVNVEVHEYDKVMNLDYKKRDELSGNDWSQNTRATYVNFDKYEGYKAISKIYKNIKGE